MLAAAAVAGLALVGGLVFATTRSDDTTPADTPVVTLPTEPVPDVEVDPDAEAVVVPAPDPTTAAEVTPEPEPVAEPVTVTLTGTFAESGVLANELPAPSSSGLTGLITNFGTTTYEGQFAGSASWKSQVWPLSDGSQLGAGEFLFTGTIEGLGSGSLTFVDTWRIVDGVWSGASTITGGTGDFEGASGTGVNTSDSANPSSSSTGSNVWTIAVPPQGSLEAVTATGTASASITIVPESDPLTWTGSGTFSGSLVGSTKGSGQGWANPSGGTMGTSRWVFTGTIEGLGTGTMTFDRIGFDPPARWFDVVVEGTGDFEGITGTGQVAGDNTYTYTLTAPENR